jgi:hypothetical protein
MKCVSFVPSSRESGTALTVTDCAAAHVSVPKTSSLALVVTSDGETMEMVTAALGSASRLTA